LKSPAVEQILYATRDEWGANVLENPAKRRKRFDEEALRLFDGLEGLLVRTAIIRHEDWPTASRGAPIVSDANAAARVCQHLRYADQENIVLLCMGSGMQVKAIFEISKGGTSYSGADMVHFIKVPLLTQAKNVILVHNHPSGKSEPSADDMALTRKVKAAFECLDIRLLDHVIIGGLSDTVFSFEGSALL
jgi:DNA repair protein RadC